MEIASQCCGRKKARSRRLFGTSVAYAQATKTGCTWATKSGRLGHGITNPLGSRFQGAPSAFDLGGSAVAVRQARRSVYDRLEGSAGPNRKPRHRDGEALVAGPSKAQQNVGLTSGSLRVSAHERLQLKHPQQKRLAQQVPNLCSSPLLIVHLWHLRQRFQGHGPEEWRPWNCGGTALA